MAISKRLRKKVRADEDINEKIRRSDAELKRAKLEIRKLKIQLEKGKQQQKRLESGLEDVTKAVEGIPRFNPPFTHNCR